MLITDFSYCRYDV